MKFVQVFVVALAALLALPSAAQTASDMQILADKVKADKKLVVAANMQLTDAEAKNFWPVYDAYQADLQKVNQRLGALIKNYANEYNKGAVSGETAKKLVNEMLAVEDAELKLKRSYVPKLEKVIPGVKVARYMQVENKIRAVIKYELAANIPLVQ
jgi:CII-binding regulator of phage lambda lysogenization HflD